MSSPVSKQTLLELDAAHVWHPFTPHSAYSNEAPLMVVAGEGNYLVDADGSRYLDAVASLWCNLFGHRRAEIDQAITEQLGRIAHSTFLGNSSEPAVTLASRLVGLAPAGLDRVFFSDNGSTAVEVALKMAYQYWQQVDGGAQSHRTTFLTLSNAYHGDTVGSVSLGGIELFHERYRKLLFETIQAVAPYAYRCDCGHSGDRCDAIAIERVVSAIEKHGDRLAAVVVEPGVQGAAGMITQPHGFVHAIAKATSRAGALLIVDEVAVGFGRSGRMFACEREGVSPDFLCLAKGLTGGYLPMAATLTTDRIYREFLGDPSLGRTFYHGHTYTGNQLAAAAALAVLDIFENDRVLDTIDAKIQSLSRGLSGLASLPNVGDVRQYGLAAGVELVRDKSTKEQFASAERIGMRVCTAARKHGVFLRPLGDTIVLMPPLSITEREITTIVEAIELGVREVCESR